MLGSGRIGPDIWEVDGGFDCTGKLDFCLLACVAQPLEGGGILTQVNAVLGLEILGEPVDNRVVHIGPAEMGITRRGEDFENAFGHLHDGNVEGAAAQIQHGDLVLALPVLVQTVSQRRRGRLVDDTLHFEPRDAAGILSRLPLIVVEVSRDRNDGLVDFLS